MMKRICGILLLIVAALGLGSTSADALDMKKFSLDSIAAWGRFPKFCIDTYRWGDGFFNGYNTDYVQSTGMKFNLKARVNNWEDYYNFRLDENHHRMRIGMVSRPSTSLGFYLTYMAVSVGYDVNVSNYLFGNERARKQFNFQFSCMLFSLEYFAYHNDVGTTITRLGPREMVERTNINFSGLESDGWGLNLTYYFNHKKYSQAAAFGFSRIQVRSAGSFIAGFSIYNQKYDFDFNALPEVYKWLPETWEGRHYFVKNRNYAFRLGYGFNWVFHKGWLLGLMETPVIGVRTGYVGAPTHDKTSFGISNTAKVSLVYNRRTRWFFGLIAGAETSIVYDRTHAMINNTLNVEASVGYRFNLW